MYAALVNYSVKSGHLNEAIRLWREEVEPAAEGQPGYEGSVLLIEPDDNKLVVVAYWDTKAHDDAFATTGPWRAGSELRNKIGFSTPEVCEQARGAPFRPYVGRAHAGIFIHRLPEWCPSSCSDRLPT
jgi:heme-degrading monooxygenase HmoA